MISSPRSVLRNLVSQWHIWLHCYTVGHNATHLRGHILTQLATLRRMATLKHILPHYDISGHTATYGHTVTHLAMLRICGHITSHLYGPVMTHLAILLHIAKLLATLWHSWPHCDISNHVMTHLVTLRNIWPPFLVCSCVYFCLYGSFNFISFHKFSLQLSVFSFCSSRLISALLVLSAISLFMKVSFSPDIIPSGWLGLKHQLTD